MEPITWIVILLAVVGAVVAYLAGRSSGGRTYQDAINAVVRRLRAGESGGASAGPPEVKALAAALDEGWAPRGSGADEARWEALRRVVSHLEVAVAKPLLTAAGGDARSLREGVGEALGALEDLDFFLSELPTGTQTVDLGALVSEVIKEFSRESGVRTHQRGPRRPVRVTANEDGLKDALFLLLHNASQFGKGRPVDVVVRVEDGHGRLHVRDKGVGFTAEALSRAYDPFYTTVDSNLGLGLSHARRLIEGVGGKVALRNSDRGGGEVELALPLA